MIRKTLDDHFETTPGICDGQPRIKGHRITVRQIVIWHDRMGMSADEIAADYGLAIADIYAAMAYYFDHRAELDSRTDSDALLIEELRSKSPSRLKSKIAGDRQDE